MPPAGGRSRPPAWASISGIEWATASAWTSTSGRSSPGDERPLVDVHADAVAHSMPEILAQAGGLDRPPAGGIHVAGGNAGAGRRAPGLLGGEHGLVGLEVVVRRLAAEDRAAEVGAVAVDDPAEVEHHR